MSDSEVQEGADAGLMLDTLWLEITRACNWECQHCYAECGPHVLFEGALEISHWEDLIGEASQMGCRVLHFIGGEPTLHPSFRRMLDRAVAADFPKIEVNTNGSRISPSLARYMSRNGVHASLSFYSASPTRHAAITGRPGSLVKTLKGIERLIENDVPTRVGLIEIDQTPEELANAKTLLRSLGVENIGGDRVRRLGRAKKLDAPRRGDRDGEMGELCNMCTVDRLCASCENQVFACPMSRSWPLGRARDGLRAALCSSAAAAFRRVHRLAHPGLPEGNAGQEQQAACYPEDKPCRPNSYDCGPDGRKGPPPPQCLPTLGCRPDDIGEFCYPCYPAS